MKCLYIGKRVQGICSPERCFETNRICHKGEVLIIQSPDGTIRFYNCDSDTNAFLFEDGVAQGIARWATDEDAALNKAW